MSKTRSCRRTPEETAIHERAVKIRKMTDEQIIEILEKIDADAWNKGFLYGREDGMKNVPDVRYEIAAFIEDVAYLPGIGKATVEKMKSVAEKRGFHVD